MELAELAARHPEASIICGHTGGDWEQGIRAVRAQRHVAVDLGGGDPVAVWGICSRRSPSTESCSVHMLRCSISSR